MLVKEEDIGTTLKKGVCSRKAGKTTTDDDDLYHFRRDIVV